VFSLSTIVQCTVFSAMVPRV